MNKMWSLKPTPNQYIDVQWSSCVERVGEGVSREDLYDLRESENRYFPKRIDRANTNDTGNGS